jgi:hypothetical protein
MRLARQSSQEGQRAIAEAAAPLAPAETLHCVASGAGLQPAAGRVNQALEFDNSQALLM